PNLMTVFEAGEIGTVCYLASAYCPGLSLKEWLRQHGSPVPPRAAADLLPPLARALQYAHPNGLCPRHLKPSNILLQESGVRGQESGVSEPTTSALTNYQPKIIDFGLAKVIRDDGIEANTRNGAVLGTPHYMAPEQAQGHTQAVGPPTDIHALG